MLDLSRGFTRLRSIFRSGRSTAPDPERLGTRFERFLALAFVITENMHMLTYAHARASPADPARRRSLPTDHRCGTGAEGLRRGGCPRGDRPSSAVDLERKRAARGRDPQEAEPVPVPDDLRGTETRARRDPKRRALLDLSSIRTCSSMRQASSTRRENRRERSSRRWSNGRIAATTTTDVIQEFAHVYSRRRSRVERGRKRAATTQCCSRRSPSPTTAELERGLALFEQYDELGAADAVLAATAEANEARALVSADRAFVD